MSLIKHLDDLKRDLNWLDYQIHEIKDKIDQMIDKELDAQVQYCLQNEESIL